MLQRQHDGADHGHQEHDAGGLEEIDVARVEDLAERLGVGDRIDRRDRRCDRLRDVRPDGPGDHDQEEFRQEEHTDQRAHREILQKSLPQLGEIDVQHHHHEQEQHCHRADVDDDQNHRQKFGAEEHEQPCRVDESENEVQH